MNQILSMACGPQKENKPQEPVQPIKQPIQNEAIKRANELSNKADLSKVIKIFCIITIIFGILLIAQSTYAMIANRDTQRDKVEVFNEQMGREAKIIIESNNPIKKFSYKWNDGKLTEVEGNGKVKFETIIQIPNGNNILRMTITDAYGSKQNFMQHYVYESSDVQKPEINIAIVGTKIQIQATDNVEMAYITYSWNEEEATRIDVDEDDKQKIVTEIEVPEGKNELVVVASDKEGNRETLSQSLTGDKVPEFTVSKDGNNIVIQATDDEGVTKISVNIDGQTFETTDINNKEISASMPVESGTHTITVTVTNVNDLTNTKKYENIQF